MFPLIHVAVGLAMVFGKFDEPHPPPVLFGWFFVILGGIFHRLCRSALAIAIIVAGAKLKKTGADIIASLWPHSNALMMPLGTILGVFTIIILMKDPVKEMFAASAFSLLVAAAPSRLRRDVRLKRI